MNGGVETALVIGATSDIGRAIAHALAEDGCALQLAARDPARLERETRDLRVRTGGDVTAHRCDVLEEDGGVSLLGALDPLPDSDQVRSVRTDQATAAQTRNFLHSQECRSVLSRPRRLAGMIRGIRDGPDAILVHGAPCAWSRILRLRSDR